MDKERILAKIDELDSYLGELEQVKPSSLEEYTTSIEKKRSCERILQIAIESVIDICQIIISDMKLGLPSDEDDMIKKLEDNNIISKNLALILSGMKGFRNILVHKYGIVDDELVFEMLSERVDDFDKFKVEILNFLDKQKPKI